MSKDSETKLKDTMDKLENKLLNEPKKTSPLKIIVLLVALVLVNIFAYIGVNKLLSNNNKIEEQPCKVKFEHFLTEYKDIENKEKLENLLNETIAYNMTNYDFINLNYNNKTITEYEDILKLKNDMLKEENDYNINLKCNKTLNITIKEKNA